jgi:glucose uptake protein GlcU
MSDSVLLPLGGVVGAALCFGSFAVPMKAKSVQSVQLHPVVFQVYVSIGVFLSSLPVLLLSSWSWDRFTCWAFLSAFMWSLSNMLCVKVVDLLGLSVGQGLWSGAVALVAFVDGLLQGQELGNTALACTGIALLILGIGGLAVSSGSNGDDSKLKDKDAKALEAYSRSFVDEGGMESTAASAESDRTSSAGRVVRGVILAFCIGLLAGSIFVPLNVFTDLKGKDQILYSVPFGVGAVISALGFLVVHRGLLAVGSAAPLTWEPRICFLPGLVSGVLWNLGNICSILSMLPPLGAAVGYPLTQACILISGLWGILFYREIKGAGAILRFFVCAVVLLAGACFLGVFGSKN